MSCLSLTNTFSLGIIFLLFLTSCTKEIEREVYEDLIVKGNKIPEYKGVTSLEVKNYINKLKVDILGEQPTEQEFEQWITFLIQEELSDSSRTVMVQYFMDQPDYYDRYFEWNSAYMLESVDYNKIDEDIGLYEYVIEQQLLNEDTLTAQLLEKEKIKMALLRSASDDLKTESITISEFYTRMINNVFYDEINMGTENFVIATFENLAIRRPTNFELQSCKNMVDGDPAVLFNQSGNGKDDFMDIFTHSSAFYQGLIHIQFDFLLNRKAGPKEMAAILPLFESSQDIKFVQLNILISDDYAGFE